ncbi:MAG TPA: protein kinase [Gemmataceae bacterium]|jgi:WD40 repeat protein|nr:protein kinase [Gemmataceae bacterium]
MPDHTLDNTEPTLTVVSGAPTQHSSTPMAGRRCGDYELLEEIARGGMGVVFRARQVSLNRIVALKMILSGRLDSQDDVQRFRQEAEAAANLDHANLLPIYDVGTFEGHPFFSMKLADGGTLAARVAELVRDPRTAARLMEQVARGIHYAHQRGILHRDLKPANILLANDQVPTAYDQTRVGGSSDDSGSSLRPQVADFGLAKKVEADSSLTQSGAILGTPAYMAPEQARGEKGVTIAADVYSLGAILFELLTGQPPFKGKTVVQTLRMVEEQDPPSARSLNPAADPDLEAVAMKCLEKDPSRRYVSAQALADDLSAWRRGEPVTARRAGLGRRAAKWTRRNPAVAVLSAAVVVALVAGSIVSAVYAVKANDRAKQAADSEDAALKQAAAVRDREEVLQDTLCVATFERARANRLAGRPGWREHSLSLLEAAARMRQRPRDAADTRVALPELADLRGEAIAALSQPDIAKMHEFSTGLAGSPIVTPFGGQAVVISLDPEGMVRIIVRDLDANAVLARHDIATPPGEVSPFAFGRHDGTAISRDGTLLANARPGAVALFALPALKPAGTLTDAALTPDASAGATLEDLEFTPDGKRLVARRSVNKEIQYVLWSLDRPDRPIVLARWPESNREFEEDNLKPRFAPDGRRLALPTADRATVRVIDTGSDPPTNVATIPMARAQAMSWHPTAPVLAIASASANEREHRVTLWDVDKKAELAHTGDVFRGPLVIAYGPAGKYLAVADEDGSVRLLDGRAATECIRLAEAADGRVNQVNWTAAGHLVTSGMYETVRVSRVVDDTPTTTLPGLAGLEGSVLSPDGRWLAIRVTMQKNSLVPEDGPRALANVLKDAIAKAEERLTIVDCRSGAIKHTWPMKNLAQSSLQFSRDGKRLSIRHTNTLVLRDVETGRQLNSHKLPLSNDLHLSFSDVAWDDQDRLLAMGNEETTRDLVIWDVLAAKAIFRDSELDNREPGFTSTQLSPNGRWLIVDPNQESKPRPGPELKPCRVIDVQSGQTVGRFSLGDGSESQVAAVVAVSPDGRRLLSAYMPLDFKGGEGTSTPGWILRSLPDGDILARYPTAGDVADQMQAVSPDSRHFFVSGTDGWALLIDAESAKVVARWRPQGEKRIRELGFTPDGRIVAAARGSRDLVFLDLAAARQRLAKIGLDW